MTWDVILCLQNIDILPVLLELHENVMGDGIWFSLMLLNWKPNLC